MNRDVIRHYDLLIEEENDPVRDPAPLRAYMDLWDGQAFFELLNLRQDQDVLEIGVGTGRLALRAAPLCGKLVGVDLSPKTIGRARENLAGCGNVSLICADFLECEFDRRFDAVYSSLTFMHIRDKARAIAKIAEVLKPGGRFILSIDKNSSEWIDMGNRKIRIFPDDPEHILGNIARAKLIFEKMIETEHAWIIAARKSEVDMNELRGFLDEVGRLTQYPARRKKKNLAVAYLAQKFEMGKVYSEKEVNELLLRWHTFGDPATLRRELFDLYFLDRTPDGREYKLAEPQPILEDIL